MQTIGKAIRDAVVAWGGVGQRVYRDQAPEDATHPLVAFNEEVNNAAAMRGDGARPMAYRRMAQVDLFQIRGDEDDELRKDLEAILDGVTLTGSDHKVLGCTVSDTQRLVETTDGIVHHAMTLIISYLP